MSAFDNAVKEGKSLLEALLDLPRTRVQTFASEVRARLDGAIQAQLAVQAFSPFTTVEHDFQKLVELKVLAAVQTWLVAARDTLGALRAQHAQRRGLAMSNPGRDHSIASFVPEKTKFGVPDDLVRISWLTQGNAAAAAVAYIAVTKYVGEQSFGTEGGTAFLIDPFHVMTACHVIEQRDIAEEGNAEETDLDLQVANARLAFDYLTDINAANFVTVDKCVARDPDLDYAILRLKQPVAATPLRFSRKPLPDPDDGFTFVANIIQHPEKQRKQLGLRNNAVWKLEKDHLYYFTDTRGGTSGAPVFNDAWQVIAMHTGWESFKKEDPIYMGRNLGFANRGTLATTLLEAIRAVTIAEGITIADLDYV